MKLCGGHHNRDTKDLELVDAEYFIDKGIRISKNENKG